MNRSSKSTTWAAWLFGALVSAACAADEDPSGEANADAAVNADGGTTGPDGKAVPDSRTKPESMAPSKNPAPSTYPAEWDVVFGPGRALPEGFESSRRTETLPKGSTYGMHKLALPCDVLWDRDVPVRLRDGTVIYADVMRPTDKDEGLPALVAWSPYGKIIPGRAGAAVPPEWFSGLAKFEGPDAAYWVCHGYATVNFDVRGAFKSEGKIHSFGSVDAADGYDAIEWIAEQGWSNGNVGMHGASWLAIAEWFIAATRPPHLKAIAPWNGQSDLYRNSIALGGIPDTMFSSQVGGMLVSENGRENVVEMLGRHPFINDYWVDKRAKVEDIQAAAYVGADIATVLHTAGTLDAFRRLGSSEKWLRVNDTQEWYDQYTPENLEDLRRFFDHYLRGEDNGWKTTPKVRVTVMDPGKDGDRKQNVAYAGWPLPDTRYEKLYLEGKDAALTTSKPAAAAKVTYDARSGETSFVLHFTENTQVVGHSLARLYLEADGANDLDVFVLVEKLDSDGTPLVPSELARTYFPVPAPGAPGRLRASLRELDGDKSTDFLPVHAFKAAKPLSAGEVVAIDIAIMPTAMRWHKGQQLKLTVAGTNIKGSSTPSTINAGTHIVHTGGDKASYLQLPVVDWTD